MLGLLPPTTVIIRYMKSVLRRSLSCQMMLGAVIILRAIRFTKDQDIIGTSTSSSLNNGDGDIDVVLKTSCLDLVISQLNSIRDWTNRSRGGGASISSSGEEDLIFVNISVFLLKDIFGIVLYVAFVNIFVTIYHVKMNDVKDWLMDSIVHSLSNISYIREKMEKEKKKMKHDLEHDLKDPNRKILYRLPAEGASNEVLVSDIEKRSLHENEKWEKGFVSGTVYSGEPEHTLLLNRVYAAYSLSNPLHTDIWPSINQMEAEIVSMTASLVNGGNINVVGCTSSGGTESIILAAKAHRDFFKKKYGVTSPEIISCTTAHGKFMLNN